MPAADLNARVERLRALAPDLHDRDFLLTWRQSETALRFVLANQDSTCFSVTQCLVDDSRISTSRGVAAPTSAEKAEFPATAL